MTTQFVPESARQAQSELLQALGSEAHDGAWMDFMAAVTRLLPDVLSVGRPSKEAIEGCAIGQLGFSSWAEMIEAPLDAGGLGWNISAWKAWRRAWAVVCANPWLLDCAVTASVVNRLASLCASEGDPIPGSAQEYESYLQAKKQKARDLTKQSEDQLRALIIKLQGLLDDARVSVIELTEAGAAARDLARRTEEAVNRLLAEKAELRAENAKLKDDLAAALLKSTTRLTRWQHLMAALFG